METPAPLVEELPANRKFLTRTFGDRWRVSIKVSPYPNSNARKTVFHGTYGTLREAETARDTYLAAHPILSKPFRRVAPTRRSTAEVDALAPTLDDEQEEEERDDAVVGSLAREKRWAIDD